MFDAGGLFMIVAPSGGKWWRLKYRFGGKEKLLSLGTYPEVGLAKARTKRDRAREQVADGVDPGKAEVARFSMATAEADISKLTREVCGG